MRVTDRSHPPVARARRVAAPGRLATTATVARLGLALVLALGALATTGLAAGAQSDPTVAPITTVSADGRTGTDGTRTLALSQSTDLDPAGAIMSVAGSGFNEDKGVYVALCVIPPRNYVPSPCGGGVDTEGTQGAAQWISSNPPSYGVGLAQPYGPGGSFTTAFTVRADIAPGIDCRQVRCAIVTRSDHTRTSDRSQDIIVPVTFRTAPVATPAPPVIGPDPATTLPPGAIAPPTTAAPTVTVPPLANPTTTAPAPPATVAADGRSVSDGIRTLGVTRSTELDPTSDLLTVSGQGFDEARGIYVSLCAVPADGAAPGPCRTGSPTANRWVSSDPPDYGVGVAAPFAAGGAFEVELTVEAVIDTATDCRTVPCAVVTRADDTAPDDRTLDLVLPVSFAATSPSTTTAPTTEPDAATPEDETDEASSVVIEEASSTTGPVLAVVLVAVVLALAAGAVLVARRRSPAGRLDPTDPPNPTAATDPASDPAAGTAPDPGPGTDPEGPR